MKILRALLRAALAPGMVALACALGAGAAAGADPRAASNRGGPSWAQLTDDQREALSPLAGDWDKFDPTRKKKWLDIAARYKDLSPEGQQKMHERMPDLAKLTPEQRVTARENFKRAYALPPDKRRELTQRYEELPQDKKRELAEMSRKKPGPTPRRGNAHGAAHAAKPASGAPAAAPGARSGSAPEGQR